MKKLFITLSCAVLLALGGSGAAFAASEDPGTYGPEPHSETPSLSGSTVAPLCSADVPWIDYNVVLTHPSNSATSHTAYLVLSGGGNTERIRLGDLVGGTLSGRVLWPGASVGSDGRGNGWPGWTFTNGEWVETTGNFAWTRGDITATIEVNPTLPVALSYPPSTPQCLTSPAGVSTTALAAGAAGGGLPATGGDSAAVVPLVWTAAGLITAGAAALVIRRARRARE